MSIGRSSHTLGRHEEEPEDAEPGKAGPVRVHPISRFQQRHGRSVSFLNNTKTATFFLQQKPFSQDEGNTYRHERDAWP